MSDRVAVMSGGKILQVATPRALVRTAQLPRGGRLHRRDQFLPCHGARASTATAHRECRACWASSPCPAPISRLASRPDDHILLAHPARACRASRGKAWRARSSPPPSWANAAITRSGSRAAASRCAVSGHGAAAGKAPVHAWLLPPEASDWACLMQAHNPSKISRAGACSSASRACGSAKLPASAAPAQQAPSGPASPLRSPASRPARCAAPGSAHAAAGPRRSAHRHRRAPASPRRCSFSSAAMVLVSSTSGRAGACTSCSVWAMNSISTSPPGAYFRSQGLRPGNCLGQLRAHVARIGDNRRAASRRCGQAAADRRLDAARADAAARPSAAPRVSAICSQVQLSLA